MIKVKGLSNSKVKINLEKLTADSVHLSIRSYGKRTKKPNSSV